MATIAQMRTTANQIQTETQVGGNTANRVGGLFNNIVDWLAKLDPLDGNSTTIKMRRDTAANFTSSNPVLAAGELGFETDRKRYKMGDGVTAWNSLDYRSEELDNVPTMGSQNGITSGAVYDALGSEITQTVSMAGGSTVANAGSVGDTVSLEVVTNAATTGWYYKIINVTAGEVYRITGYAGNTYRLWCVVDNSNKILSVYTPPQNVTVVTETVTIPSGGAKLAVNINGASGYGQTILKVVGSNYRFVQVSDVTNQVTQGDDNPVTSGAVYNAIQGAPANLQMVVNLTQGSAVRNSGNIGDTAAMSIDTNADTANWYYGILPVKTGDKFILNGYAGNTYRIYSVLDDNNVILDVSVGIVSSATAYVNHVVTIPNGGKKLVVNINGASGYNSIIKKLSVENIVGIDVFGYDRTYSDITGSLNYERKTINGNSVEDSTTNVLAVLPNNGVVEVKMNAPLGKFKVYKHSGSTYTELTSGWSHYQLRYVGDYVSEYLVLCALQAEGALTLNACGNIVKVYVLSDEGCVYNMKNTNLKGKNVAFFGDSIVQGRFCKFGNTVNMCMSEPYSNIISERIGQIQPANFGIGGACVYNNDWKSLYLNCTLVTGFDVVFLHAGTNDFGGNISMANFTSAYTYVLQTLKQNNTKVVVVTPTYRPGWTGTNHLGLYLKDYVNTEKTIAANNNCEVIDLFTLLNTTEFAATCSDGLHPNEIGHEMIAEKILEYYD